MAEAAARRRGQRLAAVLVVVGLLLLGWAGDLLAHRGAQTLVARDVQSATGVTETPAVHIDGPLFLPQVVRGAYERVHVQVRGLSSGPLVIDQVDGELTDVRVPFHDVLVRDVRAIGVGHSEETARINYPALNAYLDATGRPLHVAPGPDGQVTVGGTVAVLDRRIATSAEVALSVEDGNLQLTPSSVDTGGTRLGGTAQLLLGQRLTLTIPLGNLPFAQRLTAVEATADGLVVHAAGDAVVLEP